jgi:ubiquitin carboxyl-terminal hydrolase 2/21
MCAVDDLSLGGVGLCNLGTTCFMNAVLQCLSFTRPLSTYILLDQYASAKCRTSPFGGELLEAYAELVRELWSPHTPAAIAPRRFKAEIGLLAARFAGYGQQDAQELLRFLLDGLHTEVNRITVQPQYAAVPDEVGRAPLNDQLGFHRAWHLARDNSQIHDVFGGVLRSTLQCAGCGHTSYAWDPYCDISLEIPSDATTLPDLFANFVKKEELEGDERPTCAACKRRAGSTKAIAFEKVGRNPGFT